MNGLYILIIFLIMGIVGEMDYRDQANTPVYIEKVCAGVWSDFRDSKPECE